MRASDNGRRRASITGYEDDHFSRPRALFRLFDAGQHERLYGNIDAAMRGVPEPIVAHQLDLFGKIDPAYAAGVRSALTR